MTDTFCCCDCGNNEFIEITVTTEDGDETALECIACHAVTPYED